MMTVLITGSQGYIGTHLTSHMISEGYKVSGIDSGYFKSCNIAPVNENIKNLQKDIRDLEKVDLDGIDVVIHLAALSNDPIGELDSKLTFQINQDGAVRVAQLAKVAGVKRFVFISTQSIYGISTTDTELDEIDSVKNPQTAYAQSKWNAEQEILSMSDMEFTTTALRPSTVFGWSPRFRSDIVFNNLILNGLLREQIEVHSDGTPWRPVIHVQDVCIAIQKCIESSVEVVNSKAFNLGVRNGNYTVRELAEAAQACIGGVPIVYNTENLTDPRSYKVSFTRAYRELDFDAKITLSLGGNEIAKEARFLIDSGTDLLNRNTNRLQQVKYLLENGSLDDTLRFR
jgi:nucleoside-diphosphate-sugar epimerase